MLSPRHGDGDGRGGQFNKVWGAAGGLTPLWGLEPVGNGWAGYCRASGPTSFFSSCRRRLSLSPSPRSSPSPSFRRLVPLSTIDHRPPSPCLTSMDASRPLRMWTFPRACPRRTEEQNMESHSTDGLMLEQIGTWRVTMAAVRHCCRRHHGSTHRAGDPQGEEERQFNSVTQPPELTRPELASKDDDDQGACGVAMLGSPACSLEKLSADG